MRAETVIQRAIRMQFKAFGFDTVHVPNGAVLGGDKVRRARQMNSLKADGLMPGFPDLLVYGPEGKIGHVEVKQENGKQQLTQKICQRWLEKLGHRYVVLRSSAEVVETLADWGWIDFQDCGEQAEAVPLAQINHADVIEEGRAGECANTQPGPDINAKGAH